MANVNKHIAEDFASIFEQALCDGILNMNSFLVFRDDFYQTHCSMLKNQRETKSELEALFSRKPCVSSEELARFASATALYYCRKMDLVSPEWTHEYDGYEPQVLVPTRGQADCIEEMLDNTPPEFLDMGFIYHEKNLAVC